MNIIPDDSVCSVVRSKIADHSNDAELRLTQFTIRGEYLVEISARVSHDLA